MARGSDLFPLEAGEDPLPAITPNSLRRTFASILVALGGDPRFVMSQLGHEEAAFTLSVYVKDVRQAPGDLNRLRALVNGEPLANDSLGTPGVSDTRV